jgi:Flp pilus assembly protein TadD
MDGSIVHAGERRERGSGGDDVTGTASVPGVSHAFRWGSLLAPLLLLFAAACATVQPRTEETQPADGGPSASIADGGLPDIAMQDADGGEGDERVRLGALADNSAEAAEEAKAAEERAKEEEELKAKRAEEKAAAERLKAVQAKINTDFAEAFKSIKAGNDDAAITEYQQVIKDHPEAFAAHYNLGVIYERKGQRDQAIGEYQKALQLKSDFDPASDNLSRLYLRAGQSLKAEQELRQRILAHPRILAFRNQLVRVMMSEGRVDQAESDCKKILKIDERNVDAMLNLALIWYGQRKFELAKQVLESARDVLDRMAAENPTGSVADPYGPAVWNLLAFTQLNLDQRTLALESFRRAAELRPDYPEAHNNYGSMLNEVNDCDGATRELELAVRYAPDYAEAHLNLGNAYRCGRHYKEAQTEYEKALALNPRSLDPIFNTAILYLDGFDMHVDYDKNSPLDSEKLERLKTALTYFDKFKSAGGQDERFDRYYQEAEKAETSEQKRLEREKERSVHAEEKKKKEEERKRREAEKLKEQAEKNRAWILQYRVQGKSDFEDDKASAVSAPPAGKLGGKEDL